MHNHVMVWFKNEIKRLETNIQRINTDAFINKKVLEIIIIRATEIIILME